MLIAVDTSVLVAGALEGHAFHTRAAIWQDAMHRGDVQAVASAHALAEVYSVLTKLPNGPTPAEARRVTSNIGQRIRIVAPTIWTYWLALERCSARSLKSGVVYDALHLVTAEQATASLFLTFNPSDFERLAEGDGPRIVIPPDPPSLDITA